eukprot:COSAG06_NODE_7276_length_2563_cov_1.798701_1_plen_38_part_10
MIVLCFNAIVCVIVSHLVWCGVRPLQVDGVAIWEQAAI